MDSQDHSNTRHSPGGNSHGVHVCTKCGWNYPNPHPSAKNRRAHKKLCGTIKGFEIFDSEKAKQNLDLQEEHCLDDEQKNPNAVCEFSGKEKEETTTNCAVKSSTNPFSDHRKIGESSTDGHSKEAQVIDGGDTISNVGLETECKPDESELGLAIGKREDTLDSSRIYSDGFAFEPTTMIHPGEADYIVSENVSVHTSPVKTNAGPVSSTSQSVPDDIHLADVSFHGTKSLEEFESNHSMNPCLPETLKGEECEIDTRTGAEVPSADKLHLDDKTEPQGQTGLVPNIVISKISPEDIKMKPEGVSSETSRVSLPAVDPVVADSDADVSHAANKTGLVDLSGHESELIQANVVAEERNSPNSKPSSESSCAAENYVSPVSKVDDASNQTKSSTETSKDSVIQISAEAIECNDEAGRESSKGELGEESSFINVTNTKDYPVSHSGSIATAPDDITLKTANQKLPESGRTDLHRAVDNLGVINVKAHKVPVTIESNDHQDFGRLQNLSEAHRRSLVSSPLVSGLSGGVNKPENAAESSSLAVALPKNQEITMEKTISWSTAKEQHVPLKNLLSEARSPKLQVQAKDESSIPRVSSILDQETSPEDVRWPERKVSEEWNSPAKYPVDLKREERKVKGRPFWVPFVCCSSVK